MNCYWPNWSQGSKAIISVHNQNRIIFPGGSTGKESTCNAVDSTSIPGLERYTGEGKGYPLQCSWAFMVAQIVRKLPAMRETWVQSLEDVLEKRRAIHSRILTWRIP